MSRVVRRSPRVVAIAGGDVPDIEQVLRAMSPRSGLAYVVVSRAPHAPRSPLPVEALDARAALAADRVYLVPPPADRLMRSLADQIGDDAIGIVLSGEGVDGAFGMTRIKEAGGVTLCQDPAQARIADMPAAAIATGRVDLVLPIEAIASELTRLAAVPARASHGELHHKLVEQYAPPSVLVDAALNILHLGAHAGPYLDALHADVRAAVHAARQSPRGSAQRRARFDDAVIEIRARAVEEGMVLVLFDEIFEDARAAREHSEFLATLMHELRNPLTPLRAALELQRLRPDATEHTQVVMERHLDHLERIIDEMLDLSRVVTSDIALDASELDLREVVATAVGAFRAKLDTRRLDVAVPDERVRMHGDAFRITQVVTNLLAHAVRSTPQDGHIRIAVDLDPSRARARIVVRDDGEGFAPDELPHVFDLLVVSRDASGRASAEGFGPGLALARRLVELHGGTVTARSEGTGLGSELVVELPLREAA